MPTLEEQIVAFVMETSLDMPEELTGLRVELAKKRLAEANPGAIDDAKKKWLAMNEARREYREAADKLRAVGLYPLTFVLEWDKERRG